jgi:hypothetical protein
MPGTAGNDLLLIGKLWKRTGKMLDGICAGRSFGRLLDRHSPLKLAHSNDSVTT